MTQIKIDKNLVSMCGLYCGACSRYLKEKCSGCKANDKATWCKVRSCCMERQIPSCADCKTYETPLDCGKYNNFIAKFFSFIFNTDRSSGIARIKEAGYEIFAKEMAQAAKVGIKRK